MMSAFIILVVAASAGLSIACLVFPIRMDLALLSGPAFLTAAWTLFIGIAVSRGLTLQILWLPFWTATSISAVFGIYTVCRCRSFAVFIVPVAAALMLMAPYVVHGFASFPGSWFWDGFAYMAGGDSLWGYARGGSIDSPSLYYQFGHSTLSGRFISAALIGIFKGAFPLEGDAQAATGYFLLYCVFTFACAAAALARVILPAKAVFQAIFVIIATLSGPLLNLLWTNNFDHLLAMSMAPVMLALAVGFGSICIRQFVALGTLAAVQFYVYPELAALLILPAALIVLSRLANEPGGASKYVAVVACVLTAGVVAAPLFDKIIEFFDAQFVGVFSAPSAAARAGNGLFPTFLNLWCLPGSIFSLYQPFSKCSREPSDLLKFGIGSIGCLVVLLTLLKFRANAALTTTVVVFIGAIGFFVVGERYDYGTYKVVEVAWIPTLAFCALGAATLQGWHRLLAGALALMLVSVTVVRVGQFEQWVTNKSIEEFAELANHLPKDQVVLVSVANPLAFEWATFYLRDHNTVIGAGQLAYFPSPALNTEPAASKLRAASYLVTDVSAASDREAIWANDIYAVYKLK